MTATHTCFNDVLLPAYADGWTDQTWFGSGAATDYNHLPAGRELQCRWRQDAADIPSRSLWYATPRTVPATDTCVAGRLRYRPSHPGAAWPVRLYRLDTPCAADYSWTNLVENALRWRIFPHSWWTVDANSVPTLIIPEHAGIVTLPL